MLVVMNKAATEVDLNGLLQRLERERLTGHISHGVDRVVVGVVEQTDPNLRDALEVLPGVEEVMPLALAIIAAGADGIQVSVHTDLDKALKDGAQSLTFDNFGQLTTKLSSMVTSVGRKGRIRANA